MSTQQKLAPVVSVINMKGGVGKTTVSANVPREIFRTHGKKVLLVDFDPQFNLSQLLLTKQEYEGLQASGKTLLHIMDPPPPKSVFATSVADTITIDDVEKFTHPLRYITNKPEIKLRLVPGDFQVAMLNLKENAAALKGPRKRFDSFINSARLLYDLVVLDCNPSSSFMTRCAIENSSHLLVPVRPDKYSILGVEMISMYFSSFPNLVKKPEMLILLNDMHTDDDHFEVESQLRGHSVYGPITLVNHLPRTKILSSRTSYSGFAVDRKVKNSKTIAERLKDVGTEIAKKVGVI